MAIFKCVTINAQIQKEQISTFMRNVLFALFVLDSGQSSSSKHPTHKEQIAIQHIYFKVIICSIGIVGLYVKAGKFPMHKKQIAFAHLCVVDKHVKY